MILRPGKMSMQNTDKSIKKEREREKKKKEKRRREQNGSIKITLAETVQRPVWFP